MDEGENLIEESSRDLHGNTNDFQEFSGNDEEIEEEEDNLQYSDNVSTSDEDDSSGLISDIDSQTPIYPNSLITIKEFELSYLLMCDKLKLCKSYRALLLTYIKNLLPVTNKVTQSYNKLEKKMIGKDINVAKICRSCLKHLKDMNCVNRNCNSNNKQIDNRLYKHSHIDVAFFDIKKQLRYIIAKNMKEIVKIQRYKGKYLQ